MRHATSIRLIVIFLALAFGLSWLIALPLWFGDGLASPYFAVVAVSMMTTPAIAALIVVFFVERAESKASLLGLWPTRPVGRYIGFLAIGLVLPVALILVALPIGALLGVYPADFVGLSGFREIIGPDIGVPIETLVAAQFINVVVGAVINLIPALGEELGWRGWLLPKLLPFGTVRALIISGVVWGLWHAPLVLLGYNYLGAPGWLALAAMIAMCTLIGAIFGWLRVRSGSVWPAALAHGSFNAAAGFSFVFAAAGESIDTTQATILGWSGWIVPLIVVLVLVVTRQFSSPPLAPPKTPALTFEPPETPAA